MHIKFLLTVVKSGSNNDSDELHDVCNDNSFCA